MSVLYLSHEKHTSDTASLPVQQNTGTGGVEFSCLMTHGLSKDIWRHTRHLPLHKELSIISISITIILTQVDGFHIIEDT